MQGKKYFISGGGTGGHIYPAFTVVEKLLKQDDTEKIYYIGNPVNLEYEISKKYPKVDFLPVTVSGMPRKLSFGLIKWTIELFFAVVKTIGYMKKYKPDAVFTTGGYVSAPAVAAAKISNIPYMIHDCDSVPGLVSKAAAPFASAVSVAFESSVKVLKSENIYVNGNPIRDAFFEMTKNKAREELKIPSDKTVLYVTGGSQGAQTINKAIISVAKKLVNELNLYVIWQTGKKKYDEVTTSLETAFPEYKDNPNFVVKPYFEETVYPLKAADIVVARAGSLSLTEIIQCECPSILVPYPYAAQDHQRKNAREMCEKGVSLYLEDSDCTGENLYNMISELVSDKEKLSVMRENTLKLTKDNPTETIVNRLKSIIK